jgi:hypothetical protein
MSLFHRPVSTPRLIVEAVLTTLVVIWLEERW